MIGTVQSCNLVNPTTLSQHLCKAITIVPYGQAWQNFLLFLGQLYSEGEMKGPYEYGCLLTLSGHRSGWSTAGALSVFAFSLQHSIDCISDVVNTPVTPRKNMKAFGGSGRIAMAHEWFDNKIPNCVDFDKVGEYFAHDLIYLFTYVEQFLYMTHQTRPSFSNKKISSICPTSLCIAARARFLTFLSTPSYLFFSLCLCMLKELAVALLVLLVLLKDHPPSKMYYL